MAAKFEVRIFQEKFRYISLIPAVTPLCPLPNITEHLCRSEGGRAVQIFVKRDDLTGLAGGGNKMRKLEFLLCEAHDNGCDTVITAGGIQSNHCRQTAGAAARLGFEAHLVLNRNVENRVPLYHQSGNLVLNRLFDAKMHVHPGKINRMEKMQELAETLRQGGKKPYIIPVGGSNALGALGYVKCAFELFREQYALFKPSDPSQEITVLCATSSYGTLAGLVVGIALLRRAGELDRPVRAIGVDVDGDAAADVRPRVLALADETFELLSVPPADRDTSHLAIIDGFGAPGYGQPSASMSAAVALTAAKEGILLDPVYSGKAMAALLAAAGRGELRGTVVFVHTGGAPTLHAYPDVFPGADPADAS